MKNLYYLTEEDVKPELLSDETLKSLKDDFQRKRNDIFDNEMIPLYKRISAKQDALLNKYAREAVFSDYKDVEKIRSASIVATPEERVRLRKFNVLIDSDEYMSLAVERNKETDNLEERTVQLYQDYYYEIFKRTRPKMERADYVSKPILSPEEWLKAWQSEYDAELQKLTGEDHHADKWLPGYIKAAHTYTIGGCDESMLRMENYLANAGWQIISAHSGMVFDHPYERYLKDAPAGKYKAGEHMYWGSQAPKTSLRIDGTGFDRAKVEEVITEAGFRLTVDTTRENEWELTLPATRDGSTMQELTSEFVENIKKSDKELDANTVEQLKVQYADLWEETLSSHGDWSLYSDHMIIDRLNLLCNKLVDKIDELRGVDYDKIISQIPSENVDMDKLLRKYTVLQCQFWRYC